MTAELSNEKIGLAIPTEIVEATHMSHSELKQEIAVMLFQKRKLTLGQASKLADMSHDMSQYQFQHLLASRQIPIHYGVDDFKADLNTLKEIKDL
jgi:predicted HTH domain antitoxin